MEEEGTVLDDTFSTGRNYVDIILMKPVKEKMSKC